MGSLQAFNSFAFTDMIKSVFSWPHEGMMSNNTYVLPRSSHSGNSGYLHNLTFTTFTEFSYMFPD